MIKSVCSNNSVNDFSRINKSERTLQNIYGNKFGELFSGRSIQGDRYIQGRYIQVDCIFFASNYRLLIRGHALLSSKRKRGRCILLFLPSCI